MEPAKKRLIKSFLIAPLAGPTLFAIGVTVFGIVLSLGIGEVRNAGIVLASAPIWFAFGVPVSYIVTLIFGLPAYFLFSHKLGNSFSNWVLAATSVGGVSGLLVAIIFQWWDMEWIVGLIIFGSIFGAATGHAFWRLAIR